MTNSPDYGHGPIHGDGRAEVSDIRLIGRFEDLLLHPARAAQSVHVSLAALTSAGGMINSPDHGHGSIHGDGDAEVCAVHLIGGLKDLLLRPTRAVVSEDISLTAQISAGGMAISPDHGHAPIY